MKFSDSIKTLLHLFRKRDEEPASLGTFYRQVYKATDCGPTIGFRVDGKWVYNSELYQIDKELSGYIDGISVSSIVEGSDAEVAERKLTGTFDKDEFWKAVEEVNAEACDLWDEANEEGDENE